MKNFTQDQPLKKFNSFGLEISARYFFSYTEPEELPRFISQFTFDDGSFLVLGKGSNVLFNGNYEGLIIRPETKGIEIINDDDESVYLRVAAGETWDDLVEWTVARNYSGIENLSNIPGSVGASPVQNIGAYGVEACSSIVGVEAFHLAEKKKIFLENIKCRFGYRDSIFKHELRNQVVIQFVTYRLKKVPDYITCYGDLENELSKTGEINSRSIRNAVINIRNSKIPDPEILPNAGSFFKNPVVTDELVAKLKNDYNSMPVYNSGNTGTKLAAGWLIENAGWKGWRDANCGVHQKQSLIIVNYGGSKGSDLLDLAGKIRNSVYDKFGVWLEFEVNVI